MSSVNKVILIGRLGRDPETRFTGGGKAVCNFSIATDESFKDKSGEKQKRTEWHNIVAWDKLAEICQKYLTKGSQVYVEGKIQSREYEAKDGQKKKVSEVIINQMTMLDKRESSQPRQANPNTTDENGDYVADDSDVPF